MSDTYKLRRDFSASTRLTAQHYLWKNTLGFLLHPSIPVATDMRVADIATGNGLWLVDLSREIPAQFDGFDISSSQFPAGSWLPSNINLRTWNVLSEPDPDMHGAFDVVHMRLATFIVQNDDPRPILLNLCKLLKPGGYIQWEEVDSIDCHVESLSSSLPTDVVSDVLGYLAGRDTWKRSMKTSMKNTGLTRIEQLKVEYDQSMFRYWTDLYMSTWEEAITNTGRNPFAIASVGHAATAQIRMGAAIICPQLVWVAMKPVV